MERFNSRGEKIYGYMPAPEKYLRWEGFRLSIDENGQVTMSDLNNRNTFGYGMNGEEFRRWWRSVANDRIIKKAKEGYFNAPSKTLRLASDDGRYAAFATYNADDDKIEVGVWEADLGDREWSGWA